MLQLLITLILLPYGILFGLMLIQGVLQIPAWIWSFTLWIVCVIGCLARFGVIS